VLTGAEAWRTRMRARKAGVELPWPTERCHRSPRLLGRDDSMISEAEKARGIVMPVQVYPMFETAVRAAAGRTVDEHQQFISELWQRFNAVAVDNPYAWVREPHTAEEIRTPGPSNRMVGLPYTKYMNSNNDVDMSAAVIVCSAAKAEELGVPRDRWVFPWSGTDSEEHKYISDRWSFAHTPAIELGGRMALELAGLTIDDIDLVDLYSCFPSAVQLGAQSLGLSLDRQLTRTGGLTWAGGPWNNYVMHAIATTVQELRAGVGRTALVWANGGFVSKHSFGVYASEPCERMFRAKRPQAQVDALPKRKLAEPADAAGPATVEAYTVMYSRDGVPGRGIAACLLADGRRAWGTTEDADRCAAMCEGEWVGREVTLDAEGALLF
jgi:acetyl-CoA C-acetyltransferase